MEYTSTHSVTADETTSINAASWSATNTIPSGAAQPPTATTSGPSTVVSTNRVAATATVADSTDRLTARWIDGRRTITRVSAAPSSGITTGSGTSQVTAVSRRPRQCGPRGRTRARR